MPKYSKSLGKGNIKKLLFKQSIPAMIGLIVLSLYNLIDTIFIGRGVGTLGIASLAIVFPISMIFMSFAQMIGIGIASIISRALGSKNYEKAELALGNFLSLSIIVSLTITILAFIFRVPLLQLFGATKTIMPFALDYLTILLIGTLFITIASASNHIIRSEGNAKYAMFLMITGALINLILDPIFIFGMGMGMKGAALATVLGQLGACILALIYFFKGKSDVKLRFKNLKLNKKVTKETIKIGSSSLARNTSGNIIAIILNNSLGFYGGDLAIAAYGIVQRLFMFVMMPLFGIVQGMQPIVGYNYGAKKFTRVKKTLKLSMKYATIMSSVAFLILMIFAKSLANIFTTDLDLIELSTSFVRVLSLMLPLVGFQIIVGGMYQSMGQAFKAFIFSIMRQILFLIPLILILPRLFGLDGVLYTFPVSDLLAAIVTAIVVIKESKKLNKSKKLKEKQ